MTLDSPESLDGSIESTISIYKILYHLQDGQLHS